MTATSVPSGVVTKAEMNSRTITTLMVSAEAVLSITARCANPRLQCRQFGAHGLDIAFFARVEDAFDLVRHPDQPVGHDVHDGADPGEQEAGARLNCTTCCTQRGARALDRSIAPMPDRISSMVGLSPSGRGSWGS